MKPGGTPGRFPAPDPAADAAAMGLSISDRQAERLLRFLELLRSRAIPLGMVSRGDVARLYERHVLDSLAAAVAFDPADRRSYDLGSGAGLPGVVLAVVLPAVTFLLVESRSKRAGFLELVVEALDLENARVVVARAQDLEDDADVVTARAFAPLERSWEAARPLLRRGGRLIYFAGRDHQELEGRARAQGEVRQVAVLPVLDSSRPLVIMSRT